MMAAALQIPYTTEDFKLYKSWTREHDVRRIAFANALYRVKTGGHIQAVVSGEYNHGKSTTAMLLCRWDTIYTRELLKYYKDPRYDEAIDHLKFSIKNSVIISPKDPAAKFIQKPQLLRAYEVDEGYLWATTQEAAEKKTADLRDSMMQNRKLSPSMYWVYPNLFKMPGIMLENMMEVIHKTHVNSGIMLSPSTVIQIKEKFDKQRIERYAKKPRFFTRSMKYHSAFIFYPRFPRIKGKIWEKYQKKYKQYTTLNDQTTKAKENVKIRFFEKLDDIINKGVIKAENKKDIARYIGIAMQKQSKSKYISGIIPETITNEYTDWKINKSSTELLKELTENTFKLNTNDIN